MSKMPYIITAIVVSICLIGLIVGAGFSYNIIELPDNPMNEEVDKNTQVLNNTQKVDSNVDVINRSLKGVVTIYTEKGDELNSQGSGFIYKNDYIMTNEHVVGNSNDFYVRYKRGDWGTAELVGADEDTDIAILKPENKPDYVKSLSMQINVPERGQNVVSLGAPNGLDNTVTTGIISGIERSVRIGTEFSIPDTIQTDTALNKGNSGGPLVNTKNGAVVGVNRATEGENIGYAVSSRIANHVGTQIIKNGYHRHSYLGVRTVTLNPIVEEYDQVDLESGLVIRDVITGTPADKVLNSNSNNTDLPDIIVGIEGEKVNNNEDIASYLMRETEPGDNVTLEVYRNGEVKEINVQLTSRSGSNTP